MYFLILELPLTSSYSYGGTLALWKKNLDPYVTVLECSSSSVLPLLVDIPGHMPAIHITIYLPTSGKETEFLEALAVLDNTLDEITAKYPNACVFIRGDANVNPKNATRAPLLAHFCRDHKLFDVDLAHNTYHHFTGEGKFDSNIDVLLHSNINHVVEEVTEILCKFKEDSFSNQHISLKP